MIRKKFYTPKFRVLHNVISTGGCLRKPLVKILFPQAVFLSNPSMLMLFPLAVAKQPPVKRSISIVP
jgi:hypothetical protein